MSSASPPSENTALETSAIDPLAIDAGMAAPGVRSVGSRALTRTRRGAVRFVDLLLVQPIRAGSLRDTGWPVGFRMVVACASVAFALAVGLIVVSPLLRAWLPLSVSSGTVPLSLPRVLLPLLFALVVLSVALLQTAALHVKLVAALPITLVTCLLLLFLGGLDQGEDLGGALLVPGKLTALAAVLALIVFFAVRRRRAFAWGEFAVVLAVIGVTAVVSLGRVALQSIPFGLDFGPTTASLMMSSLGSLAAPAAMAAGVAVAELAVTASLALVGALRVRGGASARGAETAGEARTSGRILLCAFLLLAGWLAVEITLRYVTGAPTAPPVSAYPGSLALIVLVALGWLGLSALRRRGRRAEAATVPTDELLSRLNAILFPVAAALTAILGPVVVLLLIAQVSTQWGAGSAVAAPVFAVIGVAGATTVTTVIRCVAAVVFLILAVVWARHGRRAVPELLVAFGVLILVTNAPTLAGLGMEWSSEAISVLIAATTVVLALALALRRRLGTAQLAALSVALLLAEAAAWRELLANPLSALLGASAIAFILLGFVWGFLAGAEGTREESPGYPATARVLLFLANSLFGVTALAFAALARDLDVVIDLDQFAGAGDAMLGTALIVLVAVALWVGALPRRTAAPAAPRP